MKKISIILFITICILSIFLFKIKLENNNLNTQEITITNSINDYESKQNVKKEKLIKDKEIIKVKYDKVKKWNEEILKHLK